MLDSGSDMEMIQLVIGIILIVSIKFLILRIIYHRVRRSNLSEEELKFDKIRHIYNKLKNNKIPEIKIIAKYAKALETKILVYQALKKFNKSELFPKELLTKEKAAESYLANWLNMNDEYDAIPDEIEYLETKELENNITVLTFRFKSYRPHLFANKGWMYGQVGYGISDEELYIKPKFISSDFEASKLTEKHLEQITL